MKFRELVSIAHNISASLASGIGIMIGYYMTDVFREASNSSDGNLTVDFLSGRVVDDSPTFELRDAVMKYSKALEQLCVKHGASVEDFKILQARYWKHGLNGSFEVIVEDQFGRRSVDEYQGWSGRRVKVLDELGRVRPKRTRTASFQFMKTPKT